MAEKTKRDERPNILLITTDQQRGDAMGCGPAEESRTMHGDLLSRWGERGAAGVLCYTRGSETPHAHDRVDLAPSRRVAVTSV